jgi:hypothetical protein
MAYQCFDPRDHNGEPCELVKTCAEGWIQWGRALMARIRHA